ncbi:MAG: hypothetical protein ABW124_22545 [Candidatus Thiodiazotropha sp. 6PLUC9]
MKSLLIILLIVFSTFCSADIVVSENSISESYSQSIKVSGEFLVGIQTASKIKGRDKALHVMFPDNSEGWLCIDIKSNDGRYKATLAHNIEQPISGVTKIVFNSKFQEVLNKYSADEVAIKSSFKSSCNEHKSQKLLISSWDRIISDELLLLIRSDARKDTAYTPDSLNPASSAKCKRIRRSNNISYDKTCVIKTFDISRMNKIEIVRKNLQPISPEIITIN